MRASPLLLLPACSLLFAAPASAVEAADDAFMTLHCRPEVLATFADLLNSTEGYREEALTIKADGDGEFAFFRSAARGDDMCQAVVPEPDIVAIAHTHPPKDDVVQEPTGADCDTPWPNFVVTRGALYVTDVSHPDAKLFKETGDSKDLGAYRRLLGSDWRRRDNWNRDSWQRRCRQQAVESVRRASSRPTRCKYDRERAAQYRRSQGAPITCAPR